ncbi:MAG: hypothetical protein DRQ48_00255 [Gammaproteobacteria bacterium]|nr:MAG: hypothetical protein DRQ48_00255 [Gammaproteobacteria bacterium]
MFVKRLLAAAVFDRDAGDCVAHAVAGCVPDIDAGAAGVVVVDVYDGEQIFGGAVFPLDPLASVEGLLGGGLNRAATGVVEDVNFLLGGDREKGHERTSSR